jgi:Phthiocerol/phthiodiolone dimycocerosyl transferase C-terminus
MLRGITIPERRGERGGHDALQIAERCVIAIVFARLRKHHRNRKVCRIMTTAHSDQAAPSRAQRPLSLSEALFAFPPGVFVGYSILCSGALDLAALDDAFAELQQQYQTLRGTIRTVDFAPWLIAESRPPARLRAFEEEDLDILPTSRDAVFDQAEQLTHLDVLLGEERVRVTLFLHHAIADGAHALALLEELWARYTNHVETGSPLPAQPHALAESGETLLRLHGYPEAPKSAELADAELAELLALLAENEPSPLELPSRVRLSKNDTRSLFGLCRQEDITVNSLVSAALIRAHAKAGEIPLLFIYPVDLRGRFTPPIGSTEVTNMFGNACYIADSAMGLVPLARRIKERYTSDLEAGVLHRNFSGSNPPEFSSDASSYIVFSTNLGIIPQLQCPAGMAFTDFQYTATPTPFLPAFAKLRGKSLTGYVINTFDQQLSIDFVPGDLAGDDQLLADIREELRSAAKPSVG